MKFAIVSIVLLISLTFIQAGGNVFTFLKRVEFKNSTFHAYEEKRVSLTKNDEPDEKSYSFGDLTPDFTEDETYGQKLAVLSNKTLPNEWDWSHQGKVTRPQDQKHCNSCFAFAAIAAIESQMLIKYGKTEKLSEQEAMECTSRCKMGGIIDEVYSYASKGSTYGSRYPYEGRDDHECEYDKKNFPRVSESAVDDYVEVELYRKNFRKSEVNLMRAVYELGPVAVGIRVGKSFTDYRGGVFKNAETKTYNHAVLLVGYGSEYDENGRKIDYYKVKNSWGADWGEKGFGKIQRRRNICGIESRHATVPILR